MTLFAKSGNCVNCNQCNLKAPIFKMLSEEELTILNQNRYEVGYKTGENILKQGTALSHLIMLTSGIAKMYIEGLDNKNVILELILPWKIHGGPGLYVDNRYHYSITAIEPCTACFIDIQNIKTLLHRNGDFTEALVGNSSLNSVRTFERLVSLTQKQMHGRIADILIYLNKEIYQSDNFELSISRQDIGELSGMTKDSAIRILKEFENEGIIKVDGKKIGILNKELLQEISIRG
jgi:CRP/FNR family transcriptional regulator, polysaccharide utilization system transcription regulator